jgi:hypothetical protein
LKRKPLRPADEDENISVLMAMLKLQAEEEAAPILGGSSVG